ncbi:MAG: hypothetical protein ACKOCN_02280 [Planctomycetaceae bacterium]
MSFTTIGNAVDITCMFFTYTSMAVARQVAAAPGATATDLTDTFTVTIADGFGGTVTVPIG